jgi:hypothetical protein
MSFQIALVVKGQYGVYGSRFSIFIDTMDAEVFGVVGSFLGGEVR